MRISWASVRTRPDAGFSDPARQLDGAVICGPPPAVAVRRDDGALHASAEAMTDYPQDGAALLRACLSGARRSARQWMPAGSSRLHTDMLS